MVQILSLAFQGQAEPDPALHDAGVVLPGVALLFSGQEKDKIDRAEGPLVDLLLEGARLVPPPR
jgi:hypothetical protein